MRKLDEEVIGIFLADIHLSLKPPIWRSAEPDWFEAMKRPLEEVNKLVRKYKCPVICAGEIFNLWYGATQKGVPELINFALENLPDMYSIPGQHELPQHRYEDLSRSAYSTLIHAGKIQNILPGCCVELKNMVLYGFPFGYEIEPRPKRTDSLNKIHIAVVHKYIWIDGYSYPNAPEENKVQGHTLKKHKWMGYNIVVYGDNHKGFQTYLGTTLIFNCGTLMRRASDEFSYRPRIGLLYSSGEVKEHRLDISEDKHLINCKEIKELEKAELDMGSFIAELEALEDSAFDFVEAMKRYLEKNKAKVNKEVREFLLESMEPK